MIYDFGDYGCPICKCHASAGICEGFVTRLFCGPCEVSWTVIEAEEDAGPLATRGDCVAVELRKQRPSGSGC